MCSEYDAYNMETETDIQLINKDFCNYLYKFFNKELINTLDIVNKSNISKDELNKQIEKLEMCFVEFKESVRRVIR